MHTHDCPQHTTLEDGPVEGAMMPMVRINGALYVVPNTLHFYCPMARQRPAQLEAPPRLTAQQTQAEFTVDTTEATSRATALRTLAGQCGVAATRPGSPKRRRAAPYFMTRRSAG